MDNLNKFKKYFNRDFWRAFQNKQPFFEVPEKKNKKELIVENLYLELQDRSYYPSVPHCYVDRDKGNGVTRIIPVFTLKDYCVYYYCIKKIENRIAFNRIENTFGGWTLGGLMRKSEDDEMEKRREDFNLYEDFLSELYGISVSEYSFNPTAWAKAYGDLNAKLYATAKEGAYKYVAELDIANFYDSIRLDILEMRVKELVREECSDIVSILFHFLNYWNRNINLYNKQTVGIPQDAMGDCSRILANFYLQPYDKAMYQLCTQNNCKYLRYADDQFLFSENENKLNLLIFKASKTLNSLGLSVNQEKVKIFSTENLINYRSFKIFDLLKNDQDKRDKYKVEQFIDSYLEMRERSLLSKVKGKGVPLLNKALFCPALSEIKHTKRKKILSCFLDESYLKNVKSYHLEKIYKLLKNEERQKFMEILNSLSQKLIHNAFHYELLFFYQKNKIDSKSVKQRIKELKNFNFFKLYN